MLLFETVNDPSKNLLPFDGEAYYFGKVFSKEECLICLQKLLKEIEWKQDEAVIFGKKLLTKRKVAWYGDKPFEYTYSGVSKYALPWTGLLRSLKNKSEELSDDTFNSCLLNLYHTGDEGMAYHSDAEKDLKKNGAIASVSFGAERKFSFKHRASGEKVELILEDGSLLIMRGITQSHWMHRLPPTKKITTPRVNLTFRTIVN